MLIYVQAFPHDVESVHDLSLDFRPPPIGSRAELIARILEVAPSADFTYPDWGEIPEPDGRGKLLDINIGSNDLVEGFALHSLEKQEPHEATEIIQHLGLRGVDIEAGEFHPCQPLAPYTSSKIWRRARTPFAKELLTQEDATEVLQSLGYIAHARCKPLDKTIWVGKGLYDDGKCVRDMAILTPRSELDGPWCVSSGFSFEYFLNLTEATQAAIDCLDGCYYMHRRAKTVLQMWAQDRRPRETAHTLRARNQWRALNWDTPHPRAGRHVFRSHEEILAEWQSQGGASYRVPGINFAREMAVCVFPDEGRYLRAPFIHQIIYQDDEVVVEIGECTFAAEWINPVSNFVIPRSNKPVRFVDL